MRVIIAGGRNFKMCSEDYRYLNEMREALPITSVVCGMARGADYQALAWARSVGLAVDEHPALWDDYGKSAGMIRNREMAEVADALIAFPGGRGTEDMVAVALKRGLKVMLPGNRKEDD